MTCLLMCQDNVSPHLHIRAKLISKENSFKGGETRQHSGRFVSAPSRREVLTFGAAASVFISHLGKTAPLLPPSQKTQRSVLCPTCGSRPDSPNIHRPHITAAARPHKANCAEPSCPVRLQLRRHIAGHERLLGDSLAHSVCLALAAAGTTCPSI